MLTTPIVEGAYYEREDGVVCGPSEKFIEVDGWHGYWRVGDYIFASIGVGNPGLNLTRRVYLVPTDPAEVVAELLERVRKLSLVDDADVCQSCEGLVEAADLVAEKLGVGNG